MEVVTTEHSRASVAALKDVAGELDTSGSDTCDSSKLNVRLCHFQHDAFLNPSLNAFTALGLHRLETRLEDVIGLNDSSISDLISMSDGWSSEAEVAAIQSRKSATVLDPRQSTTENPLRLMISVNDTVENQIVSALSSVSTLLGRQKLISDPAATQDSWTIPAKASAIDLSSRQAVQDANRGFGWRYVAGQLRQQAIAQRTPIAVSYLSPAFSQREISDRASLMRYVYNSSPEIRSAVDRVVATTTSLRVAGEAPEAIMRAGSEIMERTSIKKYLAHMMRDIFVCGNGAIDFGSDPNTDVTLIAPEAIRDPISSTQFTVSGSDGRLRDVDRGIFLPGSKQIGSDFGISYLEPFLHILLERSMWVERLLTARSWSRRTDVPSDPQIERFVREGPDAATTEIRRLTGQIREVLGRVTQSFPIPPLDLYFPGSEVMTPAVERVTISHES